MKTNLITKLLFLTIFALATALITGCQTTKPIDWNSRVGTYTFDRAVTEFGPPDKQTTLSDGKLVAQWITHRNGGSTAQGDFAAVQGGIFAAAMGASGGLVAAFGSAAYFAMAVVAGSGIAGLLGV